MMPPPALKNEDFRIVQIRDLFDASQRGNNYFGKIKGNGLIGGWDLPKQFGYPGVHEYGCFFDHFMICSFGLDDIYENPNIIYV